MKHYRVYDRSNGDTRSSFNLFIVFFRFWCLKLLFWCFSVQYLDIKVNVSNSSFKPTDPIYYHIIGLDNSYQMA